MKAYAALVAEKREIGTNTLLYKYLKEFEEEQYEYRCYRKVLLRDKSVEDVIRIIAEKYGIQHPVEIMHRWKRKTMKFREVVAYTLTTFCGLGISKACEYMSNITGSCLARLSEKGYKQFLHDGELQALILN